MRFRIPAIAPSEITPSETYFGRRAFLAGALAAAGTALGRAGAAVLPPRAGLPLA